MIRYLKYGAIVLIFYLMTAMTVHKFYVSVTKIEYIEDQKSLQIITRVFIDDFEQLLRERYDENIVLDEEKYAEAVDTYSARYIKDKILIKINGEDKVFKFLGKEYEDDIMFLYLEIENLASINSFEITNTLLFDVFEEQQNIVRTKINSKKKSFILLPHDIKEVLKF